MKKTYYILCFVFSLVFLGAVPQTSEGQSLLTLGIRGGANFATFNNTNSELGTRTGFMAGPYLTISLPGSPISIQPEVLYAQKGAEFDQIDSGTYSISYIEIPVLVKFDIFTTRLIAPHIYAGPYLGFKVYAKKPAQPVYTSDPGYYPTVNEDYYPPKPNSTDFGFTVGAGVDISQLNIGLRYEGGLTKAIDENNARNGVFSIIAGIGI